MNTAAAYWRAEPRERDRTGKIRRWCIAWVANTPAPSYMLNGRSCGSYARKSDAAHRAAVLNNVIQQVSQ
jgi:hypothetical protein